MYLYSIHDEIYSPLASSFSYDSFGDVYYTNGIWKAIELMVLNGSDIHT